LGRWLRWTRYCGIFEYEGLAEKIDRNRKFIVATLRYGMSTGKLEATNNIIKSIIRRSFGFRNVDNLIAMIYWRTSNLVEVAERNRFNLIG